MSALKRNLLIWVLVVVIPFTLFSTGVIATMFLGYKHDTDPQGYEQEMAQLLGVRGELTLITEEKTWKVETPHGSFREVQSVIEPFYIEYWNGSQVLFFVPDDIWEAAMLAYTKYPWCDPFLPIATANSESSVYRNYDTENRKTAMGIMQFIRTTWEMMWPDENTRPPRTDKVASMDAGCRYLQMTGSTEAIHISEGRFVQAFAVTPLVWNKDTRQARYVWRLYQEIQKRTGQVESYHADPYTPTTVSTQVWWKRSLIAFLDLFDLRPKVLAYNPSVPDDFPPTPGDEWLILPYKEGTYSISWELHGTEYGDCAIDIAGGKGTIIISPINGTVVQSYTDGLKNPVIKIVNSVYETKLLHGNWNVQVGDKVRIGQPIGTESNQGNTWSGRRFCGTGSNCGFHTHFSVFKKGQACVDPQKLVNPPPVLGQR